MKIYFINSRVKLNTSLDCEYRIEREAGLQNNPNRSTSGRLNRPD